jgi:enoyl-CoA hydratase
MAKSDEFTRIRYEMPEHNIARIVLNRPETKNAQDARLLFELNDAFDLAIDDDDVKVIILAGEGKDFSSGHDLRSDPQEMRQTFDEFDRVGCWGGFDRPAAEGMMAREEEIFLGFSWRWRNLVKPTIAEVQGRVIAGGLMLVWPCDLIVASSDATFADPVVAMGLNGHEYFVHPYEVGHRIAKQMLFTGEPITAEEARQLGMVNLIVDRSELTEATLNLARKIARRSSMGLTLAKQAVNQSQDAQGIWTAIQAAYSLHILGHSHNMNTEGKGLEPDYLGVIRELVKSRDAEIAAKLDAARLAAAL